MFKHIKKYCIEYAAAFFAIFAILAGIIFNAIDSSELTHHAFRGNLIDKWHEVNCTGDFDGSGNYIGETCDDEYTLALDFGNRRLEKRMSHVDFDLFRIGDAIDYQYDLGKLGGIHNEEFNHAN